MATHNAYLAYKRDIQHLLYWIIHASNSIVTSGVTLEDDEASVTLNTTGKITLPVLVFMSKLIARHISPIPTLIYYLFHRVLGARCFSCSVSQQGFFNNPDSEIEKSYVCHHQFIDALAEAFQALGGDKWAAKQEISMEDPEHEGTLEDVIFSQKFSTLKINVPEDDEGDEDGNDEESDQEIPAATSVQKRQPRPGRGKKGKKGKKAKKQQKPTNLDEVPLESYGIIEADIGTITNYLMAVRALWKEWCELRSFVQNTWHEVAYDGLNTAVAGQLSSLAIAMIKRSESTIFAEFPGQDSYEAVVQAATGDNLDRVQRNFTLNLFAIGLDPTKYEGRDIIIKEQLLIHAYQDLVDFVADFQATRSGQPTPSMMAEIHDWDPNFDLQGSSKEQRLKWRRSYTINWLYDLVNLFSHVVVQRDTRKGGKLAYEKVDWSIHGKWHEYRRLFGLNEFAGVVTTLAMQEPGTNFKHRILPHHVFQLQCIVDSMTISRGWSMSGLRGHILETPAREFRPRRDIDEFLHGTGEKGESKGFLLGARQLKKSFDRNGELHGDPGRHKANSELLGSLHDDFAHWLGTSKYKCGLETIPPSRFSNTDSNGLWEYSPFLCGVGLMDALELAYLAGIYILDRVPEVMMLVHLHNLLYVKQYISEPANMYMTLQAIYPTAFFAGGKVPSFDSRACDFREAFIARTRGGGSRRVGSDRHSIAKAIRKGPDVHAILNPQANRFFKTRPHVLAYRQVDWNFKRIPDAKTKPMDFLLATLHATKKKQTVEPLAKGKEEHADTRDCCGAKPTSSKDGGLDEISSVVSGSCSEIDLPGPECERAPDSKGRAIGSKSDIDGETEAAAHPNEAGDGIDFSGRDLLRVLKHDILSEVCGTQFHLSFSPIWVLAFCNVLFEKIEVQLSRQNNPLFMRAYEAEDTASSDKRIALTALALYEQDDKCLKVMANVLQNSNKSFLEFVYWDKMRFTANTPEELANEDIQHEREVGGDACAVM
ncbi:hypothetical protein F5Y06DRAFT_278761 [Hypoxylon sp. FL0890]|nr:hypothetical protein F5Y06DRAFT_278761 [Hypoxylon sp. FL0890]